jgi:hypothetical protein
LHAECHTLILGKMDIKPMSENGMVLPHVHMGLHPKLENLIKDEDNQNNKSSFFQSP